MSIKRMSSSKLVVLKMSLLTGAPLYVQWQEFASGCWQSSASPPSSWPCAAATAPCLCLCRLGLRRLHGREQKSRKLSFQLMSTSFRDFNGIDSNVADMMCRRVSDGQTSYLGLDKSESLVSLSMKINRPETRDPVCVQAAPILSMKINRTNLLFYPVCVQADDSYPSG